MEQPEASSSLEQQSTLSRRDEQGRASYTPALQHIERKQQSDKTKSKEKEKESCNDTLYTFGFVMCGGQYGYIMVSKFGLHQIATHSPIWNQILHNCKSSREETQLIKPIHMT